MEINKVPQISVIVPVYNVENYLHRCVDSILSQSYTDFELILVDDGSPDNCGKICDEYEQIDKRVKVFHKVNGGVSSARNLGLNNAIGEWVAFIDSDDYVDIDYLAELIRCQKINNAEFIVTLNAIRDYTEEFTIYLESKSFNSLLSQYKFLNCGYPWGKLYNSSIIKNNRLQFNTNIYLGEDLMFALQYLLHVKDIQLLYSNKYFYEQGRQESLTKLINLYETELAGKEEFDKISNILIKELSLNDASIIALEELRKYYLERTLSSLMRLDSRSDRIKILRELDLTVYHKYKKPFSWKEHVLLIFLKRKCFRIYDLLLTLKNF